MNRKPPAAGKGRPKGAKNKFTVAFKTALMDVFVATGGTTEMTLWAQENRTEFYKIMARLIPHEIVGEGGEGPIQTVVHHIYEDGKKPDGEGDE